MGCNKRLYIFNLGTAYPALWQYNFLLGTIFEHHLNSLGLFRMRAGLGRIAKVLQNMHLIRSKMPLVQVVGTNGKGSVCTFIASLARVHGLTAALHSSPHFVSVRERLRIFSPTSASSGDLLPEQIWLEAANAIMQNGAEALTYFELVTACTVYLINKHNVDLAVLETGLGGAFDATTALNVDLVVFAPIALDHCNILGNTIAEIAGDKAAAIRKNTPVVSAKQTQEVQNILQNIALQNNTTVEIANPTLLPPSLAKAELTLSLPGEHQLDNAALAVLGWNKLKPLLQNKIAKASAAQNEQNIIAGLTQAWLPGRMQFIAPNPKATPPHAPIILDGSHNLHSIAALGHSLAKRQIAPLATIFTCMADKNPQGLIPHLRVMSTGPIFVPEMPGHPRAMPAKELAQLIGLAATPCANLKEALELAYQSMLERLPEEINNNIYTCKHPLLICGSLYLLGEFYSIYPQYLIKE